jgi:uncharacterized protein (DUF1697 family)
MPVFIALLRGINVGGSHIVPMADLRALLTGLRLRNVQTHLQSGNVLFETDEKDLVRLSGKIARALEGKFGFRVDTLLRTQNDLAAVIANNPFARSKGIEAAKLVVFFLPDVLEKSKREEIAQLRLGREETRFGDRELYIHFPDGQGSSKLPVALDRILKKSATARNWNTVTKLLELAAGTEKIM